MVKHKARDKKPSRKRYEEGHPTVSFRLDQETHRALKEHLSGTGCSFSDFVKDSLGREETMVEKRVEELASRKAEPSVEQRLRDPEGLVSELMVIAREPEAPWWCPRCGTQLTDGAVAKKGSTDPDIFVYVCPKCGFFLTPWGDAPYGIEEGSLRLGEP